MSAACPDSVSNLARFNQRALEQHVPLAGCLDLTHRCNLRCIHCYIADGAPAASGEMTTDRVLSIMDEIAEAGCLFLLITGGEPLLRPDFASLYVRAKEKGLLVTVFTNAVLVDERIARLFQEWPPQVVEVSIYGATAAVHDRITGVAGSFDRAMQGVRRLLDRAVKVTLKTVLMSVNRDELPAMRQLAATLGVKFRMDAAVFARLDGDRVPLQWRLPPAEAVAAEFADESSARDWKRFVERVPTSEPMERLYNCGAGVTAFYIDPRGVLQPCLMTPDIGYRLSEGNFIEGWRWVSAQLASRAARSDDACTGCSQRATCGYCPGFFRLETGDERKPAEYLCQLGKERLVRLKAI